MKDPRSVVFVLLMCLVAESKSQQQQTAPVCNGTGQQLMNNAVLFEGNSFSFSNQPDPAGVKWEYVPYDSNASTPIADNGTVNPAIATYYTVDATHLNISLDRYQATGLYTLTYKTGGCVSMANLIVVIDPLSCGCYPNDPGNAKLMCSIRYGVNPKYPNQPKIIWINNCGQTFNGTEEITTVSGSIPGSNYRFISYISIKRSDVAKFTCVVTFAPPDPSAPPNMATNAPSFNESCIAEDCNSKEQS